MTMDGHAEACPVSGNGNVDTSEPIREDPVTANNHDHDTISANSRYGLVGPCIQLSLWLE